MVDESADAAEERLSGLRARLSLEEGLGTVAARTRGRRTGGVVYTSEWLVREIVSRVLTPRLAGKSVEEIERVRVLDPACGAGWFLLGAAEALFEACLARYREAPEERRGAVFVDSAGRLRLTARKRGELVRSCLFGVDKDPRAASLARRALWLAVHEDEGEEGANGGAAGSKVGFSEREISENIACGNSLIAPEDLAREPPFDQEREPRIVPFRWDDPEHGFGRVTSQGGFDVILGNPPYIRIQEMVRFAPGEVAVLRRAYPGATDGGFDVYAAFVLRGLRLLREDGELGFVMPLRWMKAHYGREIRDLVAKNGYLRAVDDFGPEQVFSGVSTYTGLQFFSRRRSDVVRYRRVTAGPRLTGPVRTIASHGVPAGELGATPWYLGQPPELRALFTRLLAGEHTLQTAVTRISQGIKTGSDGIFVLHDAEQHGSRIRGLSKARSGVVEVEAGACKWLVKGGDMRRYHVVAARRVVLFPYVTSPEGAVSLLPFPDFEARFPLAARYLAEHAVELRKRESGRFSGEDDWHRYSRHQNMDLPGRPKIVIADVLNTARFAYDRGASACFLGGAAGGYGIVVRPPHDPWAVTAVLNSTLCEWMLRPPGLSDWFSGGWFSGEARFIQRLPVVPPDAPGAPDLAESSQLLHNLYSSLSTALPDAEEQRTREAIAAAEAHVDSIVFDAFGVSPSERAAIQALVGRLRRENAVADR